MVLAPHDITKQLGMPRLPALEVGPETASVQAELLRNGVDHMANRAPDAERVVEPAARLQRPLVNLSRPRFRVTLLCVCPRIVPYTQTHIQKICAVM